MENIWTKVLVETSNDGGETWKKDTRYFFGDISKKDLSNDNQFSQIENKRKIVLESIVYTDNDILTFTPDTDIIKEVKL
jgi:hypothetical protein